MGRPRKSADAKRSVGQTVKYTVDEHARLVAEAERIGAPSVTDLIRQRSLSGRVVVQQQAALAAPDRIELNRVGVNLHQLVKHLNFERGRSNAVAAIAGDAEKVLAEINAILLRGAENDS
jgi:hypothetical protein